MTRPAPPPNRVARPWASAVGGLAGAVVAATALLWYGGGVRRDALPGLPDPGIVTTWALPAARLGTQVCAVATVGLLLAAVLLSPREAGGLSAIGYRRLRAAGWTALAWCLSALLTLGYTLSDLIGQPISEAVTLRALTNFALSVNLGQALALSAVFAAAVFVTCRVSLRPTGATVALGLAVLAVVPPIFTGHTTGAGNHQLAVSSLLLHVVPVTLWAGGLLALAMTGWRGTGSGSGTTHLATAVRRFSVLATVCLVAVAGSGLLSALARLPGGLADLTTSRYGQLVLVKTGLLAVLAIVGGWQRFRALPALRDGDRRRFARVTAVEIGLFGLAIGAAVALARTPTPEGELVEEDLATTLLGFPMPGPMSVGTLLGDWLPDPLFIVATLGAAGLYLAGVWRLHRRGDRWPAACTFAFLGGCAIILVATSSGLARYGPVLFSVHMVQHLLVAMLAPILLALSGPVTLALRTFHKAEDPAWPGPREWVQGALRLRIGKVLAHPAVALAQYVAAMYLMYFTGLYEFALRSHAAHLAMMLHFLGAGYLFFWVVIGVDPAPRPRPAPPLRMVLVLLAMVLHAFLGVAIMQATTLLAADWFTALPRDWGPSPLDDQRTAGGIAWSFGEIPTLFVVGALLVQWMRADEREQRRLDRAADRADAEGREEEALAAYNAMLARLAERDSAAGEVKRSAR
ncbi:cytochrome c oxidase assembly protein [Micromonospora polyrhachis]|uniref:Putative copper resistance protein D n=1 Tax=Micromonospora polyrhachis TaxID=1282883 RepID=A0A7W7SL69_9ACTN|nr:cytochrome c oxidase assembly protein [Micromonospora polyrhachis]MBB4956769.1 putative copper resistance protein D [Micromonospora polyrhachis]